MRAGFYDSSIGEKINSVRVHDRGEPVRDHNGGRRRAVEDQLCDAVLGNRIQRAGRLVEDEQPKFAVQQPRQA